MNNTASQKDLHHQGLPRLFYATGLAILIGFILYVGSAILIPLVFAVFLSFIIVTVKNSIERVPGLGALLPDWLSFILAFAVMALALVILGQIIIANAEDMLKVFPSYQSRFLEISGAVLNYLSQISFLSEYFPEPVPTDEVTEETTQNFTPDMELFAQWQDQAVTLGTGFINEIGTTVRALGTNLVTILLYTSFMLIERGKIMKKLLLIAGDHHGRLDVDLILQDIALLVRQYISIKTTTSFLVALLSWIIMLVLGIDFAGFWALLIFSFNFIPIIGSIIAVILPSVLALVQPDGGGITLFILPLGLLTLAEQIVGSVIEPRLLGKSLNLSPLVILLALTLWGTLWGFGGMFLCIPITVTILIILSQFEDSRVVAIMLSDTGEIAPIKRKLHPPTETEESNSQT